MTLTENHVLDNTGFVLNCNSLSSGWDLHMRTFVQGEEFKPIHTSEYIHIVCLEMLKTALMQGFGFASSYACDLVDIYRSNVRDETKPQIRFGKYRTSQDENEKPIKGYDCNMHDVEKLIAYCEPKHEVYVADRDKKGLHFINDVSLKSWNGCYSAYKKDWQECLKEVLLSCMRIHNCTLSIVSLSGVADALVKVVEANKDDCPLLEIHVTSVSHGCGFAHQFHTRQIGEVIRTYAQYLYKDKERIRPYAPLFFEKPFKKTGFIHFHLGEAGLPCYREETEAEPLIVGTGGQMQSPTQTRVQVLAKSIDNLLDMINED